MHSVLEGGSQVALRVPQDHAVTVDTPGSLLWGALRWQIAHVTVTAENVVLSDEVSATTTLSFVSMHPFL